MHIELSSVPTFRLGDQLSALHEENLSNLDETDKRDDIFDCCLFINFIHI